jgi:hypothetical protein
VAPDEIALQPLWSTGSPSAIFQRKSHATDSIARTSEQPGRYRNSNTLASCEGGIEGRPTPSK